VLGHSELKADFQYHLKNDHQLAFGFDAIYYNNERGELLPYGDESTRISIDLGEEQAVESAIYLSDEFDLSARLRVLAGLRYSRYSMLGPQDVNIYYENSAIDENNIKEVQSFDSGEIVKSYWGLEPRVSLNYDLRLHNSVKASYNRNNQYIFMLSNTVAISPTDMWKLSDYHLEPPVCDQLSLGYYHNFPNHGLETSLEIYKKWTNNVVEYKDGVDFLSGDPTEMLLLQGTQDSHGIELMLKKKTGKLSGMMSYCYSKSMVQVKSDIATEQINNGQAYPSNYDRPHSVNLAAVYKANMRVSLSTIVEYSTGRPITYPITSYYSNGQEILYYSERNAYRIPDYFRVDFSINVEGTLKKKKKIHSYWMLNVYNVTGRKNAYSVYYESDNGSMQAYKLSIFGQPIVTLSWNFKFGNYTSE
jgi:outer membrane receptor protein involved in Fe transport